jgi:hypothetical protein
MTERESKATEKQSKKKINRPQERAEEIETANKNSKLIIKKTSK